MTAVEEPQRCPEDGVFVSYHWDMGDHIKTVHYDLAAAVAASGDLWQVGFMRWDEEGIENLRPSGSPPPGPRGRAPMSDARLADFAQRYRNEFVPGQMAEFAASLGYSERQAWRLKKAATERGLLGADA